MASFQLGAQAFEIVDLSLPIRQHWRWPISVTLHAVYERGHFLSSDLKISLHGFTHVDGPVHFIPGATSVADVPLTQLVGEAAVVDLSHLGRDGAVGATELEAHAEHVRRGDIVLLRTDWPLKCSWESREFWTTAPYTTRDGCEWLVQRGAKSVGYDYPPDYPIRDRYLAPERKHEAGDFATHATFFPAGVSVIEYLHNLHLLAKRVLLFALPLPVEGGDGAPARVIALQPKGYQACQTR